MKRAAGPSIAVLLSAGLALTAFHSEWLGLSAFAAAIALLAWWAATSERFPYRITVERKPARQDDRRAVAKTLAQPALHRRAGPSAEEAGNDGRWQLRRELLEQLRRGRRIRAAPKISSDGTCGAFEVWEQDVAITLEERGRDDLVTRFESRDTSDSVKAIVSGPWATKSRMDRKLQLISVFVRELDGGTAVSAGTDQHRAIT